MDRPPAPCTTRRDGCAVAAPASQPEPTTRRRRSRISLVTVWRDAPKAGVPHPVVEVRKDQNSDPIYEVRGGARPCEATTDSGAPEVNEWDVVLSGRKGSA